MYFHQIICFLGLLASVPLLCSGQKITNSELTSKEIYLAGKTFTVREKEKFIETGSELNTYLIFHKDGSADYRDKRGDKVIAENLLRWRFVGDSLYLQNGPVSLTAEGVSQTIEREPMKYGIEKAPGGYLLKGKASQMRLFELK